MLLIAVNFRTKTIAIPELLTRQVDMPPLGKQALYLNSNVYSFISENRELQTEPPDVIEKFLISDTSLAVRDPIPAPDYGVRTRCGNLEWVI